MKIPTLQFHQLEKYKDKVHHFVTTRSGGVSQPPFDSLNLGNIIHDKPEDVLQNRAIVKNNLVCDHLFIADQKHTNKVYSITEKNVEAYKKLQNPFPKSDGILTDVKNIGLLTLAADCTPILLFDPIKNVIGAVHSGWKGTALKILTKAIHQLETDFNCSPNTIIISFGPFIKKETYEIGMDVISIFKDAYPTDYNTIICTHTNPQKAYLDIEAAQLAQCKACGILPENIEFMPFNTFTDHRFFSARGNGPEQTGRFGGAIVLK
ncbi:peptidoglycan editing factor PgeF [Flammeovirga kamogawensis]|uniref:Purine nucleoside phosphorylase n=1 Tax=Flammeovirga kamogawensis TaxID=373891 RepID=A0ABX8GY87_9BACT|nr:peptidoglycan editing factor PgeF [Flammeovirga kamogawensis]MBB6459005.1 hypothetical protein [Flammeovirga kamogawensis]QWG08578.1 peptidoglycan editing factor PgeF [Flammeovirga kamogawensis]